VVYSMGLVIPFWMASDMLIQGIKLATGCGYCTGVPLALFPIMVLFLTFHGIAAARRFERVPWGEAVVSALECAAGMAVLWTSMVLWVVLRILFLKDRFVWAKTPHGEPG